MEMIQIIRGYMSFTAVLVSWIFTSMHSVFSMDKPVSDFPGEKSTIILFNASENSNPDNQGWMYLTNAFDESETVRFTESGLHKFSTLGNLSEAAGYFSLQHPEMPILSREAGFTAEFHFQIIEERHQLSYRGGFSIIILSNDKYGAEIVFRENEIWVYNTSFEIADNTDFNTTSGIIRYRIKMKGSQFTLYADGEKILSGPLRDYSAFGLPYSIQNFIFFGDDTASAGAEVHISRISLIIPSVLNPITETMILHQNSPNPFQQQTTIRYQLKENTNARIDLYDLTGRHLLTLAEGYHQAGEHEVELCGSTLSCGIYFYRLRQNGESQTKKLLRVK